ncbi:hypothetical protein CTheo_1633 [Ceratobasidium theobromae]|uniref:Uncharacterized protein n=1 Tax=Ceratobasidium theobromae TaxID=1582974 RepID=A0A5N5QTD9_9AGAM|nr:hypothetical protein CTheo_1633 [Ceratobasidium theobromae]
MPVPHASPDNRHTSATTNFMTPRTPKTPDEHGSSNLGKKAVFPHLDERHDRHHILMDRVRRHAALKRVGNTFDKPIIPEDKSRTKELLKIGQSAGQVSLGSLESLRGFSRSQDVQVTSPEHTMMALENFHAHRDGVHRAAAELAKNQRAMTYIEITKEEEPPNPVIQRLDGRNKNKNRQAIEVTTPTKYLAQHVQPQFEVLERVDHSCSKTYVGMLYEIKKRRKFAQDEAKRIAETLDQVPLTYTSWKKLDEGRQARVARFLQLPDEQKDIDVQQKHWKRDDAMALYQEYKNEPEFQADVTKVLAKRISTDPRRRLTLTNGPNSVPPP